MPTQNMHMEVSYNLLRYILISFTWTKVLSSCVSSDRLRFNMCPDHDFDGLVVSSLYLLWSKTDRDVIIQCAADCNRDQNCRAFFYNRLTLVCQGHSNSSLTIADAVPESGWVHYRYCNQRDCADVLPFGQSDGIFTLAPSDGLGNIQVFCDMQTDGGGWLVFQRRIDGTENFLRLWDDYKVGFGSLMNEFWLGNDYINRLTSQKAYTLRIDMGDFDNGMCVCTHLNFKVASEADLYKLTIGTFSGQCGNAFGASNSMSFSTPDRDNDIKSDLNCASYYSAGWWFKSCHQCNLNGVYNDTAYAKGISWFWRNALATSNSMSFSTPDRDNDISDSNCASKYSAGWWFKSCHQCNLNGVYNGTGYAKGISWRFWKGEHYSLRFIEMKFRPS